MNANGSENDSKLIAAMRAFNSSYSGLGKCRIRMKKANYRVVRKNRQMITRDSRRANR